jgi:hypothetical protein
MRSIHRWLIAGFLAVLPAASRAELKATTPTTPPDVKLTLVKTLEIVHGKLLRYDAQSVVVRTDQGDRQIQWTGLTRLTQFALRKQIVDPNSSSDWLDLAELAKKMDMRKEATQAAANAVRLDPASKTRAQAILGSISSTDDQPTLTSTRRNPTTPHPTTSTPTISTPTAAQKAGKYQKATPEQNAAAILEAEGWGQFVAEGMKIKLVTLKTPHFIIFTNWDPREYNFLKENCENAYTAVSKQFDIPVSENVFVGLLPILMLDTKEQFFQYAREFDKFNAPPGVLGYYAGKTDGSGHMVMWKPDWKRSGVEQAELGWAHTLTHEFTHAFIARYRTNQHIPRWLNEGLAEVIAGMHFQVEGAHRFARSMANKPFPFQELFDDNKLPPGSMYPVMQTMVEALIQEDRKAFLKMFDDIKDGMDPEAAMRKNYHAGYADWEKAWRNYARKLPND